MCEYLLKAKANWTESFQHQNGNRDIHNPKHCKFSIRFEAPDIEGARMTAMQHLEKFKKSLPKKRDGSLSWQDEDAKIVTTFSKVLEL